MTDIIVPPTEIIRPPERPIIPVSVDHIGEVRLIKRDRWMKKIDDTGWNRNTILDVGLDIMGRYHWADVFHIGSNNTAADPSQTGLLGWMASSGAGTGESFDVEYAGAPDYERSLIRSKRFGAGVGTGTIREVGVGRSAGNINIVARHVLAAEMPKAADETVDMYYRFTSFATLDDVVGTITLDGEVYDTLLRSARLDTPEGEAFMGYRPFDAMSIASDTGQNNYVAYDGAIGDVTYRPTGNEDTIGADVSKPSYIDGTHYVDADVHMPIDEYNLAGGIRCFLCTFKIFACQIQFTNQVGGTTVPKDNTYEFDLTFRMHYGRRP